MLDASLRARTVPVMNTSAVIGARPQHHNPDVVFLQRMGGLHGDRDRDFKDTNLIVLSQDVANLHSDVLRLFDELKRLTKNETNQIDIALINLANQVFFLSET